MFLFFLFSSILRLYRCIPSLYFFYLFIYSKSIRSFTLFGVNSPCIVFSSVICLLSSFSHYYYFFFPYYLPFFSFITLHFYQLDHSSPHSLIFFLFLFSLHIITPSPFLTSPTRTHHQKPSHHTPNSIHRATHNTPIITYQCGGGTALQVRSR